MVVLKWKDKIINLTDYVEWQSIRIGQAADGVNSTGSFEMPLVKGFLQDLDLSRPLPRNATIEITLGIMYQYVVATDTVTDVHVGYKHEVELISPEKILKDKTSAGLTVTQPQGERSLYFRSINTNLGETTFETLAKHEIILNTTENSADTTDIDGVTIKKNKDYFINFKGTVYTKEPLLDFAETRYYFINFIIEVNGEVVFTKKQQVEKRPLGLGKLKKFTVYGGVVVQNVGINDVKVYVQADEHESATYYKYQTEDVKVSISTSDILESDETIYMDYVMEKLLHNDMNERRFFLDDNTRNYLKNIPSYEWTLGESYLWLHIQRIAQYLNLLPSARIGNVLEYDYNFLQTSIPDSNAYVYVDDFTVVYWEQLLPQINNLIDSGIIVLSKYNSGDILRLTIDGSGGLYAFLEVVTTEKEHGIIVSLTPYSDLDVEAIPVGIETDDKQATIDDYASRLEIQADNVYNENNEMTELTSIRFDGEIGLVSVEDIMLPTKYGIGQVTKFEIATPKELKLVNGTVTIPKGTWVEIDADRILRKEYYETLASETGYNLAGRRNFMKNNTLWYEDGKAGIYGLDYIGTSDKTMIGTVNRIRAIYEIMLATLCDEYDDNGVYDNWDGGTVEDDNEILVRLTYKPYKSTRAVILKDDQSGFEFPTSKYLNETSNLNNPDILATYTQNMANRSGGTIVNYGGVCLDVEVPPLVSYYEDKTLFSFTLIPITKERVVYTLNYIKDYVFHSSYESYDKKERLDQISRQSVLTKVHRKNTLFVFDIVESVGEQTPLIDIFNPIRHLYKPHKKVPVVAYLTHTQTDEIKSMLPVSVEAYGRTLEFLVEMKDNYSAGLFKYQIGNETYQKDHRYTNEYGRVAFTRIKLYEEFPSLTATEFRELPKQPSSTPTSLLYRTEYNEKKDARERSVYSLQINYLSNNNAIIIYDGIAKFSALTKRLNPFNIKCAVFNRPFNAKQMHVDLAYKIAAASVFVDGESDALVVTSAKGYIAFYDEQSRELLLADNRELTTRKIYYKGVNQ